MLQVQKSKSGKGKGLNYFSEKVTTKRSRRKMKERRPEVKSISHKKYTKNEDVFGKKVSKKYNFEVSLNLKNLTGASDWS